MCGFVGLVNFNENRINQLKLKHNELLFNRGPDSQKSFVNDFSCINFYRLAINAIVSGEQPYFDKENNVLVVFNGEIYNYKILRKKLLDKNYSLNTDSEVELILKSYLVSDTRCFEEFIGMWAIVIVDFNKKTVFLSVDRFGEKPLFYGIHSNNIYFSSLLEPILQNGFPKEIRYELIEQYLFFQFIPNPNTFFKNIFKVEPGSVITINNKLEFKKTKYWEIPIIKKSDLIYDENLVISTFKNLMLENLEIYKTSEVPISLFLSGGIDSSSLAVLFNKIYNNDIEAFHIVDSDKYNELDRVRYFQNKLKLKVNYISNIKENNHNLSLKKTFNVFGEPFADSSALNIDILTKNIKEKYNYKVAVAGDGGDELFSGYISYLSVILEQKFNSFPKIFRNGIIPILNKIKNNYRFNFGDSLNYDFNKKIIIKRAYENYNLIKKLVSFFGYQESVDDYIDQFFIPYRHLDDFYKLMYYDYNFILPNDYLVKVDRISANNSVEVRCPFLNHKLVEFMIMVSKEIKWKYFIKKYPLVKIMNDYIPINYLLRKKIGFGISLSDYLAPYRDFKFESDIINEFKYKEKKLNKYQEQFLFQLLSLDSILANK